MGRRKSNSTGGSSALALEHYNHFSEVGFVDSGHRWRGSEMCLSGFNGNTICGNLIVLDLNGHEISSHGGNIPSEIRKDIPVFSGQNDFDINQGESSSSFIPVVNE